MTGRVTLEHILIKNTVNFTQLFAIVPIQGTKPAWYHELGQHETDKLSAKLSKLTRRNV